MILTRTGSTSLPARLLLALSLACSISACSYLRYSMVQAEYARIQQVEPGQLNVKHMIDRETFFISGRCEDDAGRYANMARAIAAYSSRYRPNERVDTMYFEGPGSHYGLNLPEGRYELLVFADLDGDGRFESGEAVGQRRVDLDLSRTPDKVLIQQDIRLDEPESVSWDASFAVPDRHGRLESVVYPPGTIRALEDPIFDSSFSTLGMYDPASFLEQAPTMFYALEEDLGYKIPVVFVHGIAGSARNFSGLVATLDRDRYRPWFFHYPSGGDLDQLAELFYQVFLSGKVHRQPDMPVIVVAHSMGGLVVREALNRYRGSADENRVRLFVSLATPFGGHAAAATGEKHGLIVLPSWRDLNPENPFIERLYRKPLPGFVHHELVYAYGNPDSIKLGDNSDGVVALTSQLYPPAQRQAARQYGVDSSHTAILDSAEVAAHLRALMATVENPFPPDRLRLLRRGGYDVALGDAYPPAARHAIQSYGRYLMALTNGTMAPLNADEERFIAVANGEIPARDEVEKSWLRFIDEHPELVN